MKSITEIGLQEPVRGSAKKRESTGLACAAEDGAGGGRQVGPAFTTPTYAALRCLQIDVLLVEGQYYGFSGCHRFEAHQRLGLATIKCRVRKANKQVLKMHMM